MSTITVSTPAMPVLWSLKARVAAPTDAPASGAGPTGAGLLPAFDARHMSWAQLQTSMPDIIAAAHLDIDEQIALGVGFARNPLTKVDPGAPDSSSEPQDLLAGLNSFIAGDLSRGDHQGAAALTRLLSDISRLQIYHHKYNEKRDDQ